MIVSAFPGQFGYQELLNLDVRDIQFWGMRAQKKFLQDQLRMMISARATWMDQDKFKMAVDEIELLIRQITFGRKEVIKESWESLRQMMR
jgi:hypothetical protein